MLLEFTDLNSPLAIAVICDNESDKGGEKKSVPKN